MDDGGEVSFSKPEWWEPAVDAIWQDYKVNFSGLPVQCSTSGGRTSATMALLLRDAFWDCPDRVFYGFRNTGREHKATLDFLRVLEREYGVPLVWTEYQPPPKGQAPKFFGYKEVSYYTADRTGRPILQLLEAIRQYRLSKGQSAIGPTPRSRLCTAKAKIAVGWKWMSDQVGREFVDAVGLRADEPHRVHRLKPHRKGAEPWCPLAVAGVTKKMVNEFWASQGGNDLQLMEPWGNCDGCFLKDEADLATIFASDPGAADWWEQLERAYGTACPVRRPRRAHPNAEHAQMWAEAKGLRFVGIESDGEGRWLFETSEPTFNGVGANYAQIRRQLPERMEIREALKCGREPVGDRRLIRQERRRLSEARTSFSCACESAGALASLWGGDE